MSILDFKGSAQANAWKAKLRDLNDETDVILHLVSECISEIQNESSGDPVEQLVVTAADLADATVQMINALRGIESMVDNLLNLFTQGIGDMIQGIVDSRSKSTSL